MNPHRPQTSNDQRSSQRLPHSGFALIATLSVLILLALIAVGLLSLSTITLRTASQGNVMDEARANARMALILAIADLQKAAGPDQRVTAVADLFSADPAKAPAQGRARWVGVWDTANGYDNFHRYNPKEPDTKTFVKWLISTRDTNGFTIEKDPRDRTLTNEIEIFKALDVNGNPDPINSVIAEKIDTGTDGSYAYWIEDESVKATLSWNEGTFDDDQRAQAARLSASPGADPGVFGGAMDFTDYPLNDSHSVASQLNKAISTQSLPLAAGKTSGDYKNWLKSIRHHATTNSKGVLADVKNGGLRRDLSLAFEMDGTAESENATLFNQQTTEFVGNGDQQSSPFVMPGTSLNARELYRDTPNSNNFFSSDITQATSVVRGPSWWLLRDYANLYKRLRTTGSNYALDARAYFPNRLTPATEDLVDLHSDQQSQHWVWGTNGKQYKDFKTTPINKESAGGNYYYRPVRANYAPVLLGVNAIYSLMFTNNRLQLVVDPFFIVWNPYNTDITAEKFAITLLHGFAGGLKFRITDEDGKQTTHGYEVSRYGISGANTYFNQYAKNKTGINGHVSYLISQLSMEAGEVMIFSPPNESDRSNDANVLHDELLPGMNYNANTSGIFFDEFPDFNKPASRWDPIPGTQVPNIGSSSTVEICFNTLSQEDASITNVIETSLPLWNSATPELPYPNQLTAEANFGNNLTGKEFRLNWGGRSINANVQTGAHGYKQKYSFSELGATKKSFGMLSMLTSPTDYDEAGVKMEAFSQINVNPIVVSQYEYFGRAPLNTVVKTVNADGINNLNNLAGIDIDAFKDGSNGHYGKSYALSDGDTSFPLLDIPKAPLHSLAQLSGANIGTRLFEPTHAIGNSWQPPYIPPASTYYNPENYFHNTTKYTLNDVSWQANEALFDRYFFSGIAPGYTIGASGYGLIAGNGSINKTLESLYGSNPLSAKINPSLQPYIPSGMAATEIQNQLSPQDGYKKLGAYSLTEGAFNINSTSPQAWSSFLRSNKALTIESLQGTSDSGTDTPFPLSATISDTSSANGWEKFSRLTDDQIDDLASAIVEEVKSRGPFMSLSDFVNRRIGNDDRSLQGALQAAIEAAEVNGNQGGGIRANTSDEIPNYSAFYVFPFAGGNYMGNRNNATGVPLEINQANLLLPLAPKITARSDTFTVRAFGEAIRNGVSVAQAYCEATVQRLPEYLNPTDDPWDENDLNPLDPTGNAQLDPLNQQYGRRFQMVSFRWLDPSEV